MISLLLFPLTGCKEQMASLNVPIPGTSDQEPPRSIYLPNQSIPADIKLVSAAVGVSAYGEDPQKVSGVRLERAIEQPWKDLVPSTFMLAQHKILEYGKSTEFYQSMNLSGSLDFQDVLGRRMILFYNATYRIEGNGVVISRCGIMPVFPEEPQIVALVVPGKKMPKNVRNLFNSFETLYRFAVKNAITMGRPDRLPEGAEQYYVFAFVMDRLSVTAGLRFMVDDSTNKSSGYADSSHYYDYDGWRVAMLPGTFKLLDEKPLYFKLCYQPGKEQPITKRYERQVAMFGTFDRETLREARNRPDLELILPFEAATAPIDPKVRNRWESAFVKYPVVRNIDVLGELSGMFNKEEKKPQREPVIPYAYTINSRGSLLTVSVDSKGGAIWLTFFPAQQFITDVPLEMQVGGTRFDLQRYLVGAGGTDLERYARGGNAVHYRLYTGMQPPYSEPLLDQLMKGATVTVKYSTQSKTMKDTFSLKGSSNAITAMLNGYAG